MLARPKQWVTVTQKEHDFWIRRGMPVQWAGSIREFDRSLVAKVGVALTILVSLLLTATPFILLFIAAHRH